MLSKFIRNGIEKLVLALIMCVITYVVEFVMTAISRTIFK